jgi:hypothetical protein
MADAVPPQVAALGLGEDDWRRIQALALQATPLYTPAALDDLSQPIRVGACILGTESRLSGERFASWRGRALLVWAMNAREREEWARLRGAGP